MIETTLSGMTPDLAQENVKKLQELFPDVVVEGKVDCDKLKQVLGEYLESSQERYNFTWNGKQKSLRLAQTPSLGTLRPYRQESKDWDTTQNLYIEGDNLEVLKLLQKSYHGKVKMIYIDPPYNTGKDFVYPDDFNDTIENYRRITGQVDLEGKKISNNSESSGRYHTDWLNMMYPRLRLARNLLTDDGVIFISIDDNELKMLRQICDEIFGEDNFVDTIVWKKRYGGGAKEKHLVSLHEYVLFYTKNIDLLDELYIPTSEESIQRYYKLKDVNYEVRGPYRVHPLEAVKSMDERKNLVYGIPAPDGTTVWPKRQWIWSKDRVEEALKKNELEFSKSLDGSFSIQTKQYLKDENGEIRGAKMFSMIEDIYTQHGTNEIVDLLDSAKIFPFPKPSSFIHRLLQVGSKAEDIILDFFSGSATTAHAVMKLNAEDGGKRRYIMVQLPEVCSENTDAYVAGYKNICEIGKTRIRKSGEKVINEAGLVAQNLDIGFKVLKLDNSNIIKWQPDYDNFEVSLSTYVDNFVQGRTELDVVYEIMLKYGLDLTYPVDELTINGKNIYSVGFGMLVICLDDEVVIDVAHGILKLINDLKPESTRVVFKDNGFKSDSNKTNIKEILKCGGVEELITI